MKKYTQFINEEKKNDQNPEPLADTPLPWQLVEEIASLLHDQWIDLAKGLIKKDEISAETRERWRKECFKPYSELTDRVKELDRVWARKIVTYLQTKGIA